MNLLFLLYYFNLVDRNRVKLVNRENTPGDPHSSDYINANRITVNYHLNKLKILFDSIFDK